MAVKPGNEATPVPVHCIESVLYTHTHTVFYLVPVVAAVAGHHPGICLQGAPPSYCLQWRTRQSGPWAAAQWRRLSCSHSGWQRPLQLQGQLVWRAGRTSCCWGQAPQRTLVPLFVLIERARSCIGGGGNCSIIMYTSYYGYASAICLAELAEIYMQQRRPACIHCCNVCCTGHETACASVQCAFIKVVTRSVNRITMWFLGVDPPPTSRLHLG